LKTLLIIVVLLIAGYFWYGHLKGGANKPPVATDPWYMEVRATNVVEGREIEMALFARALDEHDCQTGANADWGAGVRRTCPTCVTKAPKCSKELSPRYARLFDNEPIPSAYLSATAATARERDLRMVVYGLTDEEGMGICEILRKELTKNFTGPTRCIKPSGG
jgi:hypothetical protein